MKNDYQILTSKKASGVMTGSYPMTCIPIVWAHEATTYKRVRWRRRTKIRAKTRNKLGTKKIAIKGSVRDWSYSQNEK